VINSVSLFLLRLFILSLLSDDIHAFLSIYWSPTGPLPILRPVLSANVLYSMKLSCPYKDASLLAGEGEIIYVSSHTRTSIVRPVRLHA
jgi:hypothetical protein